MTASNYQGQTQFEQAVLRRLDSIDRKLSEHDGALKALLQGQNDIRALMVRDGAAQYHVNENVERRVTALENTA